MLLKRITTASLFFTISPYLKRVLNVIHFHVMKNFTKGAFNGVLYWFGLFFPPPSAGFWSRLWQRSVSGQLHQLPDVEQVTKVCCNWQEFFTDLSSLPTPHTCFQATCEDGQIYRRCKGENEGGAGRLSLITEVQREAPPFIDLLLVVQVLSLFYWF